MPPRVITLPTFADHANAGDFVLRDAAPAPPQGELPPAPRRPADTGLPLLLLMELVLKVMHQHGLQHLHELSQHLKLGPALLGLAAGLALFMPLHLLRAVGAGDVKLLAMVGVWLGPWLLLGATLLTLLAGGLLAVVVMLATRSSRQVLGNVRTMLTTTLIGVHAGRLAALDAPTPSAVRLPYALAIAAGTLAQVGWLLAHAGP